MWNCRYTKNTHTHTRSQKLFEMHSAGKCSNSHIFTCVTRTSIPIGPVPLLPTRPSGSIHRDIRFSACECIKCVHSVSEKKVCGEGTPIQTMILCMNGQRNFSLSLSFWFGCLPSCSVLFSIEQQSNASVFSAFCIFDSINAKHSSIWKLYSLILSSIAVFVLLLLGKHSKNK